MSRQSALLVTVVLGLTLSAASARAQSYQIVHSFVLSGGDGALPYAGLMQATNGNLYGTTAGGGAANGGGCVFTIDAAGTFTIVHSFTFNDSVDGFAPKGSLVQGTDGYLYGTTQDGGAHGVGTVFKMNTSGSSFATLHSFAVDEGVAPAAGLIQAADSNFYGTTLTNGPTVDTLGGTVFKVSADGDFHVLHAFASMGTTEGRNPGAALIQATDGNFYGTTLHGGDNGYGTVFKMDAAGTVTTLHSFIQTGGVPNGSHANLLQAADGYLYGTTFNGGANGTGQGGWGTVFKMNTAGDTYVTLHSFDGNDGKNPEGGLIQGRDGSFYGTTSLGGVGGGGGTVFRMDLSGTVSPLHFFVTSNGFQPMGTLMQAANGKIYGTTNLGGPSYGVVFRLGTTTTTDDFDGDGKSDATVFRPGNGVWYSALSGGGSTATGWGTATDIDVPGDYDGDGKSDIAVFRPSSGLWFIVQSSNAAVRVVGWGASGDTPLAGDVDADGKDDLAIYRPSSGTWFFNKSSGGTSALGWGTSGDQPLLGDFDGDGKMDATIYRPGNGVWYTALSGGGTRTTGWGTTSDIPVIGDFDGDGETDLTVFRPSTGQWLVNRSSGGILVAGWGMAGDVPISGDWDSDGKSDFIIWRPGNGVWYTQFAAGGSAVVGWGVSGDRPEGRTPGT